MDWSWTNESRYDLPRLPEEPGRLGADAQKLTDAGYELTNDETEAEAIVINTCAFIEDAKQEAINTILETARLKETGALKTLVVAGCLSELYGGEIISELPEVDAVIGAGQLRRRVAAAVEGAARGEKPRHHGDNCAAVSEDAGASSAPAAPGPTCS